MDLEREMQDILFLAIGALKLFGVHSPMAILLSEDEDIIISLDLRSEKARDESVKYVQEKSREMNTGVVYILESSVNLEEEEKEALLVAGFTPLQAIEMVVPFHREGRKIIPERVIVEECNDSWLDPWRGLRANLH